MIYWTVVQVRVSFFYFFKKKRKGFIFIVESAQRIIKNTFRLENIYIYQTREKYMTRTNYMTRKNT